MDIKLALSQEEVELAIETLRRYIAICRTVTDKYNDAKPIAALQFKLEKIFNDSFDIQVGSYVKWNGEICYVYAKDGSGGLGVENVSGTAWHGVSPKYVTKIRKPKKN